MVELNINIPKEFYNEETRCGYFVSSDVKKMWAVELDLFSEFQRVCKKFNLTYYAIAGTLLGAVRHKGFIPWDDDMDFGMFWEDFERFCDIAPKEFSKPYFLQNYKSDLYAKPDQARLRRCDTTGCTHWEYNNVYDKSSNRGIFIDIIPLFNVPDTDDELGLYQKQVVELWKAVRGFIAVDGQKHGCDSYDVDYNDYVDVFRRYNKDYSIEKIRGMYLEKCAMFNDKFTKRVGITSLRANKPQWWWNSEWFAETVELPFENVTIQCPKYYNEKLTKMYGDWRVPLRGVAQHEMYIFDTDTPYSVNKDLLGKLHKE